MKTAIKYTLYLGLALVVERVNKRLEKRFRIRRLSATDIVAGTLPAPHITASTIAAQDINARVSAGTVYTSKRRGK